MPNDTPETIAPAATPAPETMTPNTQPVQSTNGSSVPDHIELPQIDLSQSDATSTIKQPKKRRIWLWVVGVLAAVVAVAVGGCYYWYVQALQPMNAQSKQGIRVVILENSSTSQIAATLQQERVIRSDVAFGIYMKLHKGKPLQAGTYKLAQNMSVAEVIKELQGGKVAEFNITFLPGGTIFDAKAVLKKAGYSDKEIDQAFTAEYPAYKQLFAGKPAGASIEGYIYGDTYSVYADSSVEQILSRAFEAMQSYVDTQGLVAAYRKQGLTLYQGITLASIVQREVAHSEDMAHVAQVFHSRLKQGMSLGSDVTFIYGAKLLGVEPTPTTETPYNTRIHKGLPPGPIASPGVQALRAVARPSATDDLFFVAGDDGVTYFSKTNEEHEVLTRKHCQKLCQL